MEAKVLSDDGFGVERALEKAMLSSPPWEPAKQNGRNVRMYVKRQIPVTFNVNNSGFTDYPNSDPEEIKKMSLQQLLGVGANDEVISCTIAMDLPNGDIIEVNNSGNEFSEVARKLINQADKGLMLTVDAILIKKQDGSPRKMPAKVYKM